MANKPGRPLGGELPRVSSFRLYGYDWAILEVATELGDYKDGNEAIREILRDWCERQLPGVRTLIDARLAMKLAAVEAEV